MRINICAYSISLEEQSSSLFSFQFLREGGFCRQCFVSGAVLKFDENHRFPCRDRQYCWHDYFSQATFVDGRMQTHLVMIFDRQYVSLACKVSGPS